MKLNYKKSLKLITLLVSALLIATVSADIYNYLYLDATMGVQGLALGWDDGTDTGVIADINGLTCSVTGLTGPAGGTREYSDAVRLTATGATVTFYVEVIDVTGTSTGDMDTIVVKIYDTSDDSLVTGSTLTVWDNGVGSTPTSSMTILEDGIWRVSYEISWKDTAIVGDTVTAALRVVIPP